MAGTTHPSRLTPATAPQPSERFVIAAAAPSDDEAIRRLLRAEHVGGDIRLSFCRDPNSSFADAVEGDRTHTLVARDRHTGEIVGVGRRAVRTLWVNGEPRRVGYLAGVRRDRRLAGRVRLLIEGFTRLAATRQPDELPYDLSCIVSDNTPARRLFERGPRGAPIYEPLCEWTSLVIPVPPRPPSHNDFRTATASDMPLLAEFLHGAMRQRQFAPVWDEADLRSPDRCRDLAPGDFLLSRRNGMIGGCAAVWDQSSFKQTVVNGYAPSLSRWRPLVNAYHAIRRRPPLPPPGQPLRMAFLSHVALASPSVEALVALTRAAIALARERSIDWLVTGVASSDPAAATIAKVFAATPYRSVVYAVRPAWSAPVLPTLDGSSFGMEVAIL